ncbi:MAG: flagellar export protein FliJ [Betaproteobacteria bacterium]
MNQVRSCWGVLQDKAQEEVARIQAELALLRDRLQSLQATRQRLLKLHEDYARPPQAGTVSTGMVETLNRRQFADQLLTLVDRVDKDIAQVEAAQAKARAGLVAAERERLKMQSLQEHDQRQVRVSQARRERRQLDELGTLRYQHGGGR